MNRKIGYLTCAFSLITASGAASAVPMPLESRLDGSAIYDPNADLTWLADVTYAKTSGHDSDGLMPWSEANSWADSLTIGGFSDWRLPTTAQPDSGCLEDASGQDYGYNCTGSELGNLFYNVLGGKKGTSIEDTHNANFDLFSNVQSSFYWSATEYAPDTVNAWYFHMDYGYQYFDFKALGFYAWAVRSGDVGGGSNTSAVPEPTALSLIGIGALGLFATRLRHSRTTHRTHA